MITAIDFGCSRIRSVFRNPANPARLNLFVERSEYALIEETEQHHRTLQESNIPYAVCDQSLAVVGNRARDCQWLSQLPLTPLMIDGIVPSNDPPARQMLHLLTAAMLPPADGLTNLCAVVVPNAGIDPQQDMNNRDFLLRLVRMQGYEPFAVSAAEASVLACGASAGFTGISVVIGAESTDICVTRFGMPLASTTLPFGCNQIDTEIAQHFKMFRWSKSGDMFLDMDSVADWKKNGQVSVSKPVGDRERILAGTTSLVLDQIVGGIRDLLRRGPVTAQLAGKRIPILLSGGGSLLNGVSDLLTERLIQQDLASMISAVRLVADPEFAVIRGALIHAELEARAQLTRSVAA
ncbi:MAG: hypothetical protein R3C20_00885 [Planctomycetaceae bacterium]